MIVHRDLPESVQNDWSVPHAVFVEGEDEEGRPNDPPDGYDSNVLSNVSLYNIMQILYQFNSLKLS